MCHTQNVTQTKTNAIKKRCAVSKYESSLFVGKTIEMNVNVGLLGGLLGTMEGG